MIRNERGYALLLVIFMMMLFVLLGVAILGASLGGAARTETRENDVQSLHLAEKTLNEAVTNIVMKYDGKDDISLEELSDYMNELKNNANPLTGKNTSTELSGANAALKDITIVKGSNEQRYTLTLTSEATVNGVKRKLVQNVLIDSYPEFLQYAFGSEQDVIINGAAYGLGNIYAGHELLLDNKAKYMYNSKNLEQSTQYPKIDGGVFVSSARAIKYYDEVLADYESISMNDQNELQNLLGITYENINIKDSSKFISINVEESFLDKAAIAAGNGIGTRDSLKAVFNVHNVEPFINQLSSKYGVKRVAPRSEPALPDWDNETEVNKYNTELDLYNKYISIFNSKNSESIIFDGNLTLDGVIYKQLLYGNEAKASDKWFIVNGDLIIDNLSTDELNIKANILVTGNVNIRGKKIKVDSTIFCLGIGSSTPATIVQDAEIKGIKENGKTKQLVLISKADILLNRFDAFTNFGEYAGGNIIQNRLDAFFYTDGEAELYGVGSTLWLNGGFFAKGKLTINAVLGNVTEDIAGGKINFNTLQTNVSKLNSRFIIDYNDDFFEDQYSGLPRVKQISVMIGNRKLEK
ncbi:hypothetical protein FHS15_002429 [Paenibacillus castaneae]|uniref:hypothetical protein n=1 Tax=Paenibacillus castaneae TaxID=474957 RepID=UPI000C9B3C5E|nr:hypothetical protein [Paenibacillus castaneae]NIK77293.1 hypothetical protein [Paenibacillus castaneae]